jgi:hypothetical protein
VEDALEAEVAEALSRVHYERGAAPGGGYRNRYRRDGSTPPRAQSSTAWSDRAEPFVSRVRGRAL